MHAFEFACVVCDKCCANRSCLGSYYEIHCSDPISLPFKLIADFSVMPGQTNGIAFQQLERRKHLIYSFTFTRRMLRFASTILQFADGNIYQ